MNIQIIGTKKCKTTQKAERFFKERNIKFHSKDLNQKGLSEGELNNIISRIKPDELIDENSKEYKKRNMAYLDYDPAQEILEHPLILKTPIVRCGSKATVGFEPDTWKDWIAEG